MVFFDNYLISAIYLADGFIIENSLFTSNGEGDFNFCQETSIPFKGLKLMIRRKTRDAKIAAREEDLIVIEEKVISAIPWSQVVRLDFEEVDKLDEDVLKLLGIEESGDLEDILGENHRS